MFWAIPFIQETSVLITDNVHFLMMCNFKEHNFKENNFWSVHSCRINCFIDGHRAVMRSGKTRVEERRTDDSLEKNSRQDKAESFSPSFLYSLLRSPVHESKVYNSTSLPDVERRSAPGKTHCHHRPLPMSFSFPSIRSVSLKCPLLSSLAQRETAFHDVHTKIATPLFDRPLSVRSLPSPSRVTATSCSPCSGLNLLSSRPRSPRRRLAAETCITDSSKLLPLIAFLEDIVESRVTVFTNSRRGGCYELFKSFYYAMSIYITRNIVDSKEKSLQLENYHFSLTRKETVNM